MKNYILSAILKLYQPKTFCPLCQGRDKGFDPLPDFYKSSSEKYGYKHFGNGEMTALDTYLCRNCGATDRERLYAWWLSEVFLNKADGQTSSAIHFAPESALSNFIKREKIFLNYQTADLFMEGTDYKVDLMCLPFPDNTFDFFICSHVLEHVTDDHRAIAELHRVTKKGGRGILMAPIILNLSHTIEDPSITDPSERWRLFGQDDHVRLYSKNDYISRIKKSGFTLLQFDCSNLGTLLFKKLGLKQTSVLYVAAKL